MVMGRYIQAFVINTKLLNFLKTFILKEILDFEDFFRVKKLYFVLWLYRALNRSKIWNMFIV